MSYRSGLGESMRALGYEPGPPRITCDGCGAVHALNPNKAPPSWFLRGKAVPGWRTERRTDGLGRNDYCPRCRTEKGSEER